MELSQRKEQFSNAYLRAVAAAAGCSVAKPEPDEDKIDWNIRSTEGQGLIRSPSVEIQLKCTELDTRDCDTLRYELDVETHGKLRDDYALVPRILVVVLVPPDPADWLLQSEEELAMRRCGYWLSLRDEPPSSNRATVTVNLPRTQLFTVEALHQMLQTISHGGPI